MMRRMGLGNSNNVLTIIVNTYALYIYNFSRYTVCIYIRKHAPSRVQNNNLSQALIWFISVYGQTKFHFGRRNLQYIFKENNWLAKHNTLGMYRKIWGQSEAAIIQLHMWQNIWYLATHVSHKLHTCVYWVTDKSFTVWEICSMYITHLLFRNAYKTLDSSAITL